jgi:phosphoribosylaminoimidazole-succinocarboxamide synthase
VPKRGAQKPDACRFDWNDQSVKTNHIIEILDKDLFLIEHKLDLMRDARINGVASGERFWQEGAREFHCYADVPGAIARIKRPYSRCGFNRRFVAHQNQKTVHWFLR